MSSGTDISPGLTVVNAILFALFGHSSQPFDWIALYLWIINDFSVSNPVVRSLVFMPFFRFLGDVLNKAIATYFSLVNTYTADFANITQYGLPGILWYTGELYGDMYLPLKASAICGGHRLSRFAIWGAYGLILIGKIAQIIKGYYFAYLIHVEDCLELYTYCLNSLDIYVVYAGMINDCVCSIVLYSHATKLIEFKPKKLLRVIQKNSSFRVIIYTVFKLAVGIYWSFNVCEANISYENCPFYFLRNIITTLDYQLYYLDFLFIQYFGKENKAIRVQPTPVKQPQDQETQPIPDKTLLLVASYLMSTEQSISPALTITNSILWSFFGHFSQSFDWIALYLWTINDFTLSNAVVRSLVLMPAFRLLGDAVWEGIETYDTLYSTKSPFMQSALPSPLWYSGELFGDMYLPLKANAIAGEDRYSYMIIWGAYSLVAAGKVGQVTCRMYLWYKSQFNIPESVLTYYTNTLDIYVMFAGMINDYACSVILYSRAKKLFKIKRREILNTIKTNSSFRIVIYTIFKTVVGIYWALNICDTYYTTCPFYFLRDIIITLDYQMYYLDYFLIQHYGKEKKYKDQPISPEPTDKRNTSEPLLHHSKKKLTTENLLRLERKLAAENQIKSESLE
ncbi:hypothetical protein HDV06_003632 [Boothiomyces sp. JEL0866]|nr:hypothetical protein HDV06_003632 [Boothiomyces sp. JEL0866]